MPDISAWGAFVDLIEYSKLKPSVNGEFSRAIKATREVREA